jgi:hypothetical protein
LISIAKLQVSGSPSLLVGALGAVHLYGEEVTFYYPFGSSGRLYKGAVSTTGAASISAVLINPDLALDGVGRRSKVRADSLEITAQLAGAEESPKWQARVETPTHLLTVSSEDLPSNLASPRPIRIALKERNPPRYNLLEARGLATLEATILRVEQLTGKIDGAPFSGSFHFHTAAKPHLVLGLQLTDLEFTSDATHPKEAETLSIPVKTTLLLKPDWLGLFDADAKVDVAKLKFGPVPAEKASATGSIRDGILDIAFSAGRLYDGSANARYSLSSATGRWDRHELNLSLNRVRALPLLYDLFGVRGLEGWATGRMDVQSTVQRESDFLTAISGSADITVEDGRIRGLDLMTAIGMNPFEGLGHGSSRDFGTPMSLLAARVSIYGGTASFSDLVLKTRLLDATGTGTINLAGQTLDLTFRPTVPALESSGKGRQRRGLQVPIRVYGAWNAPAVSADLSPAANNPLGTVQSLQDLGNGIIDQNPGVVESVIDMLLSPRPPVPRKPK